MPTDETDPVAVDRKVLESACRSLGVDPDGDNCPPLDTLAESDLPLRVKLRRLRRGISRRTGARVSEHSSAINRSR